MAAFERVVVVVMDGLGVGEMPDAEAFGDRGANTLGHVLAQRTVDIPNLRALGIVNVVPGCEALREPRPAGAWGRMAEGSNAKDTAAGHWEIMGLLTSEPFRTYPQGFPPEILRPFEERIGRRTLGNCVASGTEILKELGEEHVRTGFPIVYTSADSVFQIAAHEETVPLEQLYEMCRAAYDVACVGGGGVCRVIARPFLGRDRSDFKRTPNRRDFAVPPGGETVLDRLQAAGVPTYGVGKIEDIFAGRGLSGAVHTKSDSEGVDRTLDALVRMECGLIFTNLVDFDSLFGHRNDLEGYARNLEALDRRVPELVAALRPDDLLVFTADHGCDPGDVSTDHTREHVPLLACGPRVPAGRELGTRATFADIGATVAENFGLGRWSVGTSFLGEVGGHPAA